MEKRICKNTFKGRHYILVHRRSDAEFCTDDCKWVYQNQVRKLGEAEHAKQTRLHDNLEMLKQVKRDGVVQAKLLPLEGCRSKPVWISGEFMGVSAHEMSLKHRDGRIDVYDLQQCKVSLLLKNRVDALPFDRAS